MKARAGSCLAVAATATCTMCRPRCRSAAIDVNHLFEGDALDVCTAELRPSFDLVYLDPPFNVGGAFSARTQKGEGRGRQNRASGPRAYDDAWGGRDGFLHMLRPRLSAIRACMNERATLWLHLDHRTVHYAKVLCDEIFGESAFRGEIIWVPGNGARGKRGPSVTHQTLLVFSRSEKAGAAYTWNADDPSLREPFARTSLDMHFKSRTKDGRAFRERTIGGKTYRYFADQGRRLGSVWTDISAMVANTPLRKEATGYPTQKPEKLLERIVRAASDPGNVVADLMCGSGTTLVVAARLGRSFIGADASPLAIRTTTERLAREQVPFRLQTVRTARARLGSSFRPIRSLR
jgi:site-specific DNA-methyltransferase (adenine-specific)